MLWRIAVNRSLPNDHALRVRGERPLPDGERVADDGPTAARPEQHKRERDGIGRATIRVPRELADSSTVLRDCGLLEPNLLGVPRRPEQPARRQRNAQLARRVDSGASKCCLWTTKDILVAR
jgi:hypothetical protein